LQKTSEAVTIYSIVNTLVSEENIDKVQFLINGEVTNLYRKIAIDQPLERNLDIIKSEK
jgi:germination protein M